jgi:hypothetical protein
MVMAVAKQPTDTQTSRATPVCGGFATDTRSLPYVTRDADGDWLRPCAG